MPRFLAELVPLHSELILIVGAMLLLLWGAFRPETAREAARISTAIAPHELNSTPKEMS